MYKICDLHTHIVPNIDDGSLDLTMSVKMLKSAYTQGIRSVVCTSHSYGNIEEYHKNLKSLKSIIKRENININLYSGCEIFCNTNNINTVIYKLNNDEICTINQTKYVLIEFDSYATGIEITDCVKQIINNGYKIIIAHVERYKNLFTNDIWFNSLCEMGCLFQVNAYSFQDESKCNIRAAAKWLLKTGRVSFIGSDAHRTNHRPYMIKNGIDYILKNCDDEYVKDILYRNAKRILDIV